MRRFATVIIMDPNESVPLDECVLYKGEEKLTELTDQELFFELNIKELLDEHNTRRVKHVDRKSKNETNLEPARIRDLRMVVVNGASF